MSPLAEADAAGSAPYGRAQDPGVSARGAQAKGARTSGGQNWGLVVPGVKDLAKDLVSVTVALAGLKSALAGASSTNFGAQLAESMKKIGAIAKATKTDLDNLAKGGSGGGGGAGRSMPSAPSAPSTSPNAAIATNLAGSASAAVAAAGGGSTATSQMGSSIGGVMGNTTKALTDSVPFIGGALGGLMQFGGDMAMFPLRFARERIQNNRNYALAMTQEMTPYQWATGRSQSQLLGSLKNIPGGMQGDVSDILGAMTYGRQAGAMQGFGGQGGRYSNQFYNYVGSFQQVTPGIGAGKVAQMVGNQLGNTPANQAAAFYTSGAFSMVSAGGKGMKSPSEWAEGIMNWLKNQRPGRDRGKEFNYGELLGQQFPGSNINAWFQQVGVSAEMRDYWWSWALARARGIGGGGDVFKGMSPELDANQAVRKVNATTAQTRNEFGLAGQMTGQYANREQSNQWYNQLVGALTNRMIPGMTKGVMGMIQYMPDEVENFLWNAMESAGPLAQMVGGGIGWAQAASGLASGVDLTGDLGDIGDAGGGYGAMGGTSLAGLHPDMKKKVGAMMRANPRLSVTSGLRDKYTAAKLQRKGVGHFGSGVAYMGDIGDRKANGHGAHSGGWAADLGPRSEYGWIQRNAHKFGLNSGGGKGEPWHVQMGDIGDGGLLGAVGGVVNGALDLGSHIPVVGGLFSAAGAAMDGIEMLGKVLSTVFGAVTNLVQMTTGGGLLSAEGAGPDAVPKKVTQFLDLMGLGKVSGNTPDVVQDYKPSWGKGLPTNIDFTGSWRGDTSGATGASLAGGVGGGVLGSLVGGSVTGIANILQKYAGNNTVQAKKPDDATQARMRTALQAAAAAGFSGDELITIVSLAGRESNFRPEAYNGNLGTGDNSYGLWQINTLGGMWEKMKGPLGLSSKDQLKDPMNNARAAKYLFDQSSTPFFAWGPYRGDAPLHGGAEDWVPAVYSVAQQSGMVGDLGDYASAGGGGRLQAIQFNNTFHIQGGSTPNGGLDVGRLVPIMADRLEGEMKKRLAVSR